MSIINFINELSFVFLQSLTLSLHTASLLSKNIDGVIVFHIETGWGVGFIDWGTIKSESDLVDVESLSVAVSVHEFFELGILFDFKLNNTSVLATNFQVNVLGGSIIGFWLTFVVGH